MTYCKAHWGRYCTVRTVSAFVVEEDHVLEGDIGGLVDLVEVGDFGARVDFQVVEEGEGSFVVDREAGEGLAGHIGC